MESEGKSLKFEKENLGRYFRMCLRGLSHHYTGMDTSRLTGVSLNMKNFILMFPLGLDLFCCPRIRFN
jgi:hypothetical protein